MKITSLKKKLKWKMIDRHKVKIQKRESEDGKQAES